MKTLTLLLCLLYLFGCNTVRNQDNIEIDNHDFDKIVDDFYKYSKNYVENVDDIVSVAIERNKNDTVLTLYASVKLRPEYFIGNTEIKGHHVFFYSDSNNGINGFFKITSPPKIKADEQMSSGRPPYMWIFNYRNGKFIFKKT
jgi:hypothetical protein